MKYGDEDEPTQNHAGIVQSSLWPGNETYENTHTDTSQAASPDLIHEFVIKDVEV